MIKKIFVILVMIVVCGCTTVKTETISNMYQDNTNDDDFFDDFFSDD